MTTSLVRRAVAGAIALTVSAGVAGAQDVDARWRAWTGCWAPTTASVADNPTICVVPVAGTSAVELVSVVGSRVVNRARIEADGVPHPVSRDGCTGTETARWATSGTRLYTSESVTCTGGVTRRGMGVMSFTQNYEWLDVRGMSSGDAAGTAVARYHMVVDTAGLPADVQPAFALRGPEANNAILAASAPLTLRDIADVATAVDSGVASTWLVERTRDVKVSVDAKQLISLADQGVPSSVIDVLVALAHPAVFAFNTNSGDAAFRERAVTSGRSSASLRRGYGGSYSSLYGGWCSTAFLYDPWSYGCYSRYGYGYGYGYSPFGYSYYSPYYSPYYGYYPGSYPIVVVNRPPDNNGGVSGPTHGRVVKGRGYTSGSSGSSGSSGGASTTTSSAGSSSSGGGSIGASSGSASSGSSGSSSSGRTAVRKPPGGN